MQVSVSYNATKAPFAAWEMPNDITNDSLIDIVKGDFKSVVDDFKKHSTDSYDMPFVTIGTDEDYDDERSGEVTVLLEKEFNVYPMPVCTLAPRTNENYCDTPEGRAAQVERIKYDLLNPEPEKKKRAPRVKGHTTADKVREMITDNPDMGQEELVNLAIQKFEVFQAKPGRAKVYVRENLVKIRG